MALSFCAGQGLLSIFNEQGSGFFYVQAFPCLFAVIPAERSMKSNVGWEQLLAIAVGLHLLQERPLTSYDHQTSFDRPQSSLILFQCSYH